MRVSHEFLHQVVSGMFYTPCYDLEIFHHANHIIICALLSLRQHNCVRLICPHIIHPNVPDLAWMSHPCSSQRQFANLVSSAPLATQPRADRQNIPPISLLYRPSFSLTTCLPPASLLPQPQFTISISIQPSSCLLLSLLPPS